MTEALAALLRLEADLCASYGVCEAGGEQGWGVQSSRACLAVSIGYCLGMIAQSVRLPRHPPPASCSRTLLSACGGRRGRNDFQKPCGVERGHIRTRIHTSVENVRVFKKTQGWKKEGGGVRKHKT